MENAPIIRFLGYNLPSEIEEKYNNWTSEAYLPNLVKLTPTNEVDRYYITKKEPAYPNYFALWHWDYVENIYKYNETQWAADMSADIRSTFSKIEWVWNAYYYLMRSFRNQQGGLKDRVTTIIENAPFIAIEAFQLNPEEEGKYAEWCIRYANRIYIPLLMKIPGVRGFDRFRNSGLEASPRPKESTYPAYVNILYFENETAFQDYENSPELSSYRRAMKSDLSQTIVPRWSVQYHLIKSFRK